MSTEYSKLKTIIHVTVGGTNENEQQVNTLLHMIAKSTAEYFNQSNR